MSLAWVVEQPASQLALISDLLVLVLLEERYV
jgi:hypothetical protein